MLDLNTRIHFHEVEIAVFVNEKLDSSCVVVAALLCGSNSRIAHFFAQLGADDRTRALLKHLLIASLHGAVALAKVDIVAVFVGNYLYLDMMRIYEKLFDVD